MNKWEKGGETGGRWGWGGEGNVREGTRKEARVGQRGGRKGVSIITITS